MKDQTKNFEDLIEKAKRVFEISELKVRQDKNNYKFGLSLCATPMLTGKGVILGINWGGGSAADKTSYSTQNKLPTKEEFLNDYNKGGYRFIQRSKDLISEFLKIKAEDVEFNYTNVCLFRSPNISDLSIKDVRLCVPILEKFIELINPPWILSLGNTNIKYLKPNLRDLKRIVKVGTSHIGYTGTLWSYKIYSVPHPNARKLTNDVRHKIWKSVFSGQR
jgi:uracil-DNA glycosylase family 4